MKPLLITRPEPGLTASYIAAQNAGLKPVAAPLFTIAPVDWEMPACCDSLLLGSANVLRHGGAKLARIGTAPVYAVGKKTAKAARQAGLNVVFAGDNTLQDCAEALISDGYKHALRLTGRKHDPLRGFANLTVETVICYETVPLALIQDAIDRLAEPSVITAYSGEAVIRIEEELARQDIPTQAHILLAISQNAADKAKAQWRSIAIAHQPDDVSMLAQARILCQRVSD